MAFKERLIKKSVEAEKVVMSGVREMTLAEEIRNLAELGVEDHVIERMMDKYNRMLKDHEDTCNRSQGVRWKEPLRTVEQHKGR